ncbi:MAG: class GN sortase [Pseudorhodoplanes sp.]
MPLQRARSLPEVPLRARFFLLPDDRWGGLLFLLAILIGIAGIALTAQGIWMPVKARLAQLLLERAFAETLATGADTKPWSWADTWPIARIEVPRLNANAIVLHGSSGQALAFGPGHVETTPPAGSPGTAVYSAHRDTHFRFLKDITTGDRVVVTLRTGDTHRFRVTHSSVVRWDQSGIDPFADGHHLILATCWPLDAKFQGPMRYLVHAERVADQASGRVDRSAAGDVMTLTDPSDSRTAASARLTSPTPQDRSAARTSR